MLFPLKSLKAAYKNTYFIADAALYVAETIKALADEEQLFITRVPQKLKEAKSVLANLDDITWTELRDGYAGAWHECCYGGVQQRWLIIRSTHAKHREKHILDALISKKTEASLKSYKKLCRKAFACETDANAVLQQWLDEQEFTQLCDSKIIRQVKPTKRGRPGYEEQTNSATNCTMGIFLFSGN